MGRDSRCPWPAPPTYRCNIRAGESSGELGTGSSEPVVWPEWGGPAADGDEIFRSPHPREVGTAKQNEMLRCNYAGSPSMSRCGRLSP